MVHFLFPSSGTGSYASTGPGWPSQPPSFYMFTIKLLGLQNNIWIPNCHDILQYLKHCELSNLTTQLQTSEQQDNEYMIKKGAQTVDK